MKSMIRFAVAAALATYGAGALADITQPATGNGEIFIYVDDTTTQNVFVEGLQVGTNSLLGGLSTSAYSTASGGNGSTTLGSVIPTVSGFSFGSGGSLTLNGFANFLTNDTNASGDSIVWGVIGGSISGNGYALGAQSVVTTVNGTTPVQGGTTPFKNQGLTSAAGNVDSLVSLLNGSINTGVPGDGASAVVSYKGGTDPIDPTLGGQYSTNSAGTYTTGSGGSQNLYSWTTGQTSGGSGKTQIYSVGTLSISSGGVVSAANAAAVPLPAGLWLFGSGLLGLVGVGRRKSA
jgi:hypothetical protein